MSFVDGVPSAHETPEKAPILEQFKGSDERAALTWFTMLQHGYLHCISLKNLYKAGGADWTCIQRLVNVSELLHVVTRYR